MDNKITKCIVILGGGLSNSKLSIYSKQRCDLAIEYYNTFKNYYDLKIIVTCGGTYHYPNPIDENNFTIFESTLHTEYLLEKGIDEKLIYKESVSYDTIGNAFFVKLLLTDVRKWYNLIIITNEFHLDRSKAIFNFLYCKLDNKYNLEFCSSKDSPNELLNLRIDKEYSSLEKFKKNIKNINSLEEFHEWLFQTHECYKSKPNKKQILKENLLYY
jgi:hypothetical protein